MQAGDTAGVVSVYEFMQREPTPVLYDVGMLAWLCQGKRDPIAGCVPWLPMLAQGWALLGDLAESMPAAVRDARQYIIPALWTTFASEGTHILMAAIGSGELQ